MMHEADSETIGRTGSTGSVGAPEAGSGRTQPGPALRGTVEAGALRTPGIHHVTAIAGDPVANLRFWRDDLGLRLVKRAVNFDDPSVHHLYFGDHAGRPGTILTFFPWPGARRGRRGVGQTTRVAFAVPPGSLDFWERRFDERGVSFGRRTMRFGDAALDFLDPDGLHGELVESGGVSVPGEPERAGVPSGAAIRGFHGVTLEIAEGAGTAAVLGRLGFVEVGRDGARRRFAIGEGGPSPSGVVDLVEAPDHLRGHVAVGSIHHVAFRARDDAEQAAWLGELAAAGLHVSPVRDRRYFRSIYFREPGGVLFEIATDGPGFSLDEPVDRLGTELRLPPWLEGERQRIEAILPHLGPVEARAGGPS